MRTLYKILFLMLCILLFIGILTVLLGILNMGDDVNMKQQRMNATINYIVGFPVGLFKEGFPLLQSTSNFWRFPNLVLLGINTFIQACGIYYIAKFIQERISSKK